MDASRNAKGQSNIFQTLAKPDIHNCNTKHLTLGVIIGIIYDLRWTPSFNTLPTFFEHNGYNK